MATLRSESRLNHRLQTTDDTQYMPRNDLTVGTEVEYPRVQQGEPHTTLRRAAHYSGDVRSDVRDDYGQHGWPDGHAGSDPTAGLELRSDPMSPAELKDWYRMSIAELSKYKPHEPTGITANSSASTIGNHLHISPLGSEQAHALYEMSCEPWFQIFACTGIVEEPDGMTTFQLFRDNYCSMNFDDSPRSSNDCVTLVDPHEDHWEWRMLEPVTPDHFDLVIDFIQKLAYDPQDAREFAQNLVDNADPRLTAIKRAKKVGIVDKLEQDEHGSGYQVERSALPSTAGFYQTVVNESEAPYIYRVEDMSENNAYYVMYSENYSRSDDPFEIEGVVFNHNSVLNAQSLTEVSGSIVDDLRNAVRRDREGLDHSDSPTKTDATEELVQRIAPTPSPATSGGAN